MTLGSFRDNVATLIRQRSHAGSRVGAALLGAVLLAAFPVPAAASNEEDVGTAIEAWYRGNLTTENDPVCVLPCPEVAAPESPYPEDTLHVGVSGGRETARTYFTLDLSELPPGSMVTGGSVRLPVAGADAGTTTTELAGLVACGVDGIVSPARGGPPSDAPPADCSRSAPLELDEDGQVFTFDLAPLTTAQPTLGDLRVAVMPSELAAEEAQTWRVAFHGRNRDTEDAEPITAQILYRSGSETEFPEPDIGDFEPDQRPEPPANEAEEPPSFGSGQSSMSTFDPPPPPIAGEVSEEAPEDPVVAPDEQQLSAPPEPTLAAAATGPAYPQVWLLPLVFLAVGGLLTRSLSLDYAVDLDDLPSTG